MELTVSPAPHIHDNLTVSKCMYNVIIALLPAFAVSLYFFGIGALIVTLSSILLRHRRISNPEIFTERKAFYR